MISSSISTIIKQLADITSTVQKSTKEELGSESFKERQMDFNQIAKENKPYWREFCAKRIANKNAGIEENQTVADSSLLS
jgi:hypothetical protein